MAASARLQNLQILESLREGNTTGAMVPASMPAVSAPPSWEELQI